MPQRDTCHFRLLKRQEASVPSSTCLKEILIILDSHFLFLGSFLVQIIVKVQEIKVDQNSTKSPQKHEKDFAGNLAARPPHLNLTMSTLGVREPSCQQNIKTNKLDNSKQNKTNKKQHNMHKGDHSHQSASQHPKFLVKMITNTNTFLDIRNYLQQEKGRKENRKRKESGTIIPG